MRLVSTCRRLMSTEVFDKAFLDAESSASVKSLLVCDRILPLLMTSHFCRTLIILMVKVKLSLCLTKHHAMKAYWWSEDIAPRIL
jgi:hypothetical protein